MGLFKKASGILKTFAKNPLKGLMAATTFSLSGGTYDMGISAEAKAEKEAKLAGQIEQAQQMVINQEANAANERAQQAQRAQLLSLRKNYTKNLTQTVNYGGSGSSDDSSQGSIKLG